MGIFKMIWAIFLITYIVSGGIIAAITDVIYHKTNLIDSWYDTDEMTFFVGAFWPIALPVFVGITIYHVCRKIIVGVLK
jgi:hypothetical protein